MRTQANRSIRVFVSSTFSDMTSEREHLAKFIFPQLRKACAERGVTWGEVDLRWGIPAEHNDSATVICLAEVQRCHPYFIGLLGERYGYVPETIPIEVLEKHPILKPQNSKSVTELEMRLACLAQDAYNPKSHFYFRDPKYLDRLPVGTKRADFETAASENKQKLSQLKQDIRDVARLRGCALREGYQNVQELGEWVFEDFTRLLDEEFPVEQIPDLSEQEKAEHLAFARSQALSYIEQPGIYAILDTYIESTDTHPLIVTGEAGVGKSALLANWHLKYIEKQPDEFSLIHFIGVTQDSSEIVHVLRRIMLELKNHPKIKDYLPDKIPAKPEAIRREFPNWLVRAASANPITLILDGINYLEGETATELGWLPDQLPSNCHLILSTSPSRSLEIMHRRGWREILLSPLSEKNRKKLLVKYLAGYSRKLSPARVDLICAAEQAGNPLFLRTLLEELRRSGLHDNLEKQIKYYLKSETIIQLFERVLEGLEKDYQPEQGLARKSLSWIVCSRKGLSESELLEMLGNMEQPMPMRWWAPFSLAIESFMLRHSGLLNFSTPYFRKAVEQRYLSTPELKQQSHHRLADYFAFLPIPAMVNSDEVSFQSSSLEMRRVLDELPYQESRAKSWQSLVTTLTLPSLFEVAFSKDEGLEWIEYWQLLRRAEENKEIGHLDVPEYYRGTFRQMTEKQKFVLAGSLGQFLKEADFPVAAEEYFKYELEHYPKETPVFLQAATLNDQAKIAEAQGENLQAMALYEKAEDLLRTAKLPGNDFENKGHLQCMASVLMNSANLMSTLGMNESVEAKLQEALHLMKEATGEGTAEVATVLQSLGNYATSIKDFPRAHLLLQQAYEMRLKCLGPNHRDVGLSLYNIANLLVQDGKFFRGMECMQRSVDIFKETVGVEHTFTRQALSGLEQISKLDRAKPESNFGLVLLVLNTIPVNEDPAQPDSPEAQRRMSNELQETLVDHWDEMITHETTIPIFVISFPGFETIVASALNSNIAKKYPKGFIKVAHIPALNTSDVAQINQMLPLLKFRQELTSWLAEHPFQMIMVKPFSNNGAKVDRRILQHYGNQKPPTPKWFSFNSSKGDFRPISIETVPFDGLDGPLTGLYKNGNESRPALLPSASWQAQNYRPQAGDMRATGTLYFNLPLTRYCLQGTSKNALELLSAQLLMQFSSSERKDQPNLFEHALRDLATVLKIQILNCEPKQGRGMRGYRSASNVF